MPGNRQSQGWDRFDLGGLFDDDFGRDRGQYGRTYDDEDQGFSYGQAGGEFRGYSAGYESPDYEWPRFDPHQVPGDDTSGLDWYRASGRTQGPPGGSTAH